MPYFFRPPTAWVIVPANQTFGSDVLSYSFVRAGQPLRPNTLTPSASRSWSGLLNPVAAMTSSTSTGNGSPLSERRVWTVIPFVGALQALDRRVQDVDAAPDLGVLPRLDVARADTVEGMQVDRELRRPRRGEDDRAGPLEEPARELEPGVLLADDEEPLAGVGLGRPRVGVVGGELDARASRAAGARRRRPRRSGPSRDSRHPTCGA